MRLLKTLIRVLVLACAALLSASTLAHAHAAMIRASSPGLKEATLFIDTEGPERFVAGQIQHAQAEADNCPQ